MLWKWSMLRARSSGSRLHGMVENVADMLRMHGAAGALRPIKLIGIVGACIAVHVLHASRLLVCSCA